MQFDFDWNDLPPMGMVSDILVKFDENDIPGGIDVLLKFDDSDLLDNGQWPELVSRLEGIFPTLDSSLLPSIRFVLFRWLQTFTGTYQMTDVLQLTFTHLQQHWIPLNEPISWMTAIQASQLAEKERELDYYSWRQLLFLFLFSLLREGQGQLDSSLQKMFPKALQFVTGAWVAADKPRTIVLCTLPSLFSLLSLSLSRQSPSLCISAFLDSSLLSRTLECLDAVGGLDIALEWSLLRFSLCVFTWYSPLSLSVSLSLPSSSSISSPSSTAVLLAWTWPNVESKFIAFFERVLQRDRQRDTERGDVNIVSLSSLSTTVDLLLYTAEREQTPLSPVLLSLLFEYTHQLSALSVSLCVSLSVSLSLWEYIDREKQIHSFLHDRAMTRRHLSSLRSLSLSDLDTQSLGSLLRIWAIVSVSLCLSGSVSVYEGERKQEIQREKYTKSEIETERDTVSLSLCLSTISLIWKTMTERQTERDRHSCLSSLSTLRRLWMSLSVSLSVSLSYLETETEGGERDKQRESVDLVYDFLSQSLDLSLSTLSVSLSRSPSSTSTTTTSEEEVLRWTESTLFSLFTPLCLLSVLSSLSSSSTTSPSSLSLWSQRWSTVQFLLQRAIEDPAVCDSGYDTESERQIEIIERQREKRSFVSVLRAFSVVFLTCLSLSRTKRGDRLPGLSWDREKEIKETISYFPDVDSLSSLSVSRREEQMKEIQRIVFSRSALEEEEERTQVTSLFYQLLHHTLCSAPSL